MGYCPRYPDSKYLEKCIVLSKEENLESTDSVLAKYGKNKFESVDEYGRPLYGWTVGIFEDGIKRLAPCVYDPELWTQFVTQRN